MAGPGGTDRVAISAIPRLASTIHLVLWLGVLANFLSRILIGFFSRISLSILIVRVTGVDIEFDGLLRPVIASAKADRSIGPLWCWPRRCRFVAGRGYAFSCRGRWRSCARGTLRSSTLNAGVSCGDILTVFRFRRCCNLPAYLWTLARLRGDFSRGLRIEHRRPALLGRSVSGRSQPRAGRIGAVNGAAGLFGAIPVGAWTAHKR